MNPRVLLIDNYDSFTYNLYQAFCMLGAQVTVKLNDEITVEQALAFDASHLVISPGPGEPQDAGITESLLKKAVEKLPVLGVCLGEQGLAHAFGGKVIRAPRLMHGMSSPVYHDGRTIYEGLPNPFPAGRYHSLIVEEESLPKELFEISSYTSQGEIMGIRMKGKPVEGVQFHPESILTPEGQRLLGNFLELKA